MITLNILLLSTYTIYFLIIRRKLDLFLIGFISTTIYFISIFTGYIHPPYEYPRKNILLEVNFFYHIILYLMIFFSLIYDQNKNHTNPLLTYKNNLISIVNTNKNLYLLLFFGILITFDFRLLKIESKSDYDGIADIRFQLVLVYIYYISIILWFKGSLFSKFFSITVILLTVYFGFRSYFAIYAITLILLELQEINPRISLKKITNIIIGGLVVFTFFILLKQTYSVLRFGGDINLLLEIFSENPSKFFLAGSEFLSTQYILNDVIDNDYRVGINNFLASFLNILPIPKSFYGFDKSLLNYNFQKDLFPDVEYGMASNPWAEGYSYFGYFGLLIFPFFYCLGIYFFQYILSKYNKKSLLCLVILPCSIYWTFYMHRNSIGVTLGFIRNYLYAVAPIMILYWISRKSWGRP